MSRLVVKAKMRAAIPFPWERSVFVFFATVFLGLCIYLWQPLPQIVYKVPPPYDKYAFAISIISYITHMLSTFMLDHYELLGLKQAFRGVAEKDYPAPAFKAVGLYKFVRHPMYTFFLFFLFCTPVMSAGRLLFAGCCLAFVLWSLPLEEGTLQATLGEPYARYRRAVPALIPTLVPYSAERQKAGAKAD